MKAFLLYLIRGYQNYISPKHPGYCRYSPTCSNYAMEAIKNHGAARGLLLAIWRVLRCNPFSRGGYDPVPETFLRIRKKRENVRQIATLSTDIAA